MLSSLYQKMIGWARHRHAPYYLAGVSFAEASFFPLPPDVMLAPMVMARPERWWQLAWLTTLFSILGGILGYTIGFFAFELVGQPIIDSLGLAQHYNQAVLWFADYGIWIILLAGFTPIPYKLFTIAAGASMMPLLPFVGASIVGRSIRFFLVSGLIKIFGPRIEKQLLRSIDHWGWFVIGILILGICLLSLR